MKNRRFLECFKAMRATEIRLSVHFPDVLDTQG